MNVDKIENNFVTGMMLAERATIKGISLGVYDDRIN